MATDSTGITDSFSGLVELDAARLWRVGLPLLALGIGLLNNRPLWGDEHNQLKWVDRLAGWDLLTVSAHQQHPPTWYAFHQLVGANGVLVVSLLAFAVTTYATMRLGAHLYGPREGTLAGLLVAFSPVLAEQAGWIRPYAAITALLAVGLWLTITGDHRRAALAMVAGASLHALAWFGPAFLAVRWWRTSRRGALAVLAGGSIPLAWVLAWRVAAPVASGGDPAVANHLGEPTLLNAGAAMVGPLSGATFPAPVAVLLPLLIIGLYADADTRLAQWVAIPPIALVAISWLVSPILGIKYLAYLAPAIALAAVRPGRAWWHRGFIWAALYGLYLYAWLMRLTGGYVSRRLWVHALPL